MNAAQSNEPIDVLPYLQSTMADVTIEIFLGQVSIKINRNGESEWMSNQLSNQKYKSPEYSKCVVATASNIAELLGLSNTQSYLARNWPRVWFIYRW